MWIHLTEWMYIQSNASFQMSQKMQYVWVYIERHKAKEFSKQKCIQEEGEIELSHWTIVCGKSSV